MFTIRGLSGGYPGRPVLHGIDLELPADGRLALLGRNGVGKTTLVRALTGLLPRTHGEMDLDGGRIDTLSPHERVHAGLVHVPQGRGIFARLTVRENLEVAARAHLAPNRWRDQVDDSIAAFPALKPKLAARARDLSGGQQQILAIARALLTRPKVLILDEPSEGIQPSIRLDIAQLLLQIHQSRGIAILLIEQDLRFTAEVCPEAIVMDRGAIVARHPTRDLAESEELQRKLLAL